MAQTGTGSDSQERRCVKLTAAELATLKAAGWTVHSGPHDTQAECELFCYATGTGTVQTGTGSIQTGCCPDELPDTLYATVFDGGGEKCTCVGVLEIELTYKESTGRWESVATALGSCGVNITLEFYCPAGGSSPSDFRLDVQFSAGCTDCLELAPGVAMCDPLVVAFECEQGVGSCCEGDNGTIAIVITE